MIDHTITVNRNLHPATPPRRESFTTRVILVLWAILFALIVGAALWLYLYRPEIFASWWERLTTVTVKGESESQQEDQDASELFVPRSEQIVPDIRPPVIGGQDVDDSPVENVKETVQSDTRATSDALSSNQFSTATDSSQNRQAFGTQSIDPSDAAPSQANSARVPERSPSASDTASVPSASGNTTTANRSDSEPAPRRKHVHPNPAPRNADTRTPKSRESINETSRPSVVAAIPKAATVTEKSTSNSISGSDADALEVPPTFPTTDTQTAEEPLESEVTNVAAASDRVDRKLRKRGLVIIVNKANAEKLSKTDIRNIYRDRITRWPSGDRILVLDLPLESVERRAFSSAILNMSARDAATETSNAIITNRMQNEHRVKNPRVIVSYVERHKNAIGYVPAEILSADDDVRVAYSIP